MTNPFETEQGGPATDNSGVTASVKFHAGYDSPMIVVKGGSARQVLTMLEDTEAMNGVVDAVAALDKYAHDKAGVSAPAPGAKPGSGRPASATQHPTGKKMYCEHDGQQVERVYKSGVAKSGKNAGKEWRAFDCARGDENHPRIWDRD